MVDDNLFWVMLYSKHFFRNHESFVYAPKYGHFMCLYRTSVREFFKRKNITNYNIVFSCKCSRIVKSKSVSELRGKLISRV